MDWSGSGGRVGGAGLTNSQCTPRLARGRDPVGIRRRSRQVPYRTLDGRLSRNPARSLEVRASSGQAGSRFRESGGVGVAAASHFIQPSVVRRPSQGEGSRPLGQAASARGSPGRARMRGPMVAAPPPSQAVEPRVAAERLERGFDGSRCSCRALASAASSSTVGRLAANGSRRGRVGLATASRRLQVPRGKACGGQRRVQ